jgi:hypothetical protein
MRRLRKSQILKYVRTTFYIAIVGSGFTIRVTKKELKIAMNRGSCKKYTYSCDITDNQSVRYMYHTIVILF